MAYVFNAGLGGASDSLSDNDIEYSYNDTGQYVVSVTVYDYCGNDSTVFDTIHVINNNGFPNNSFELEAPSVVCPGASAYLVAPSGFPVYVWDYGDGSSPDSLMNRGYVDHIYQNLSD